MSISSSIMTLLSIGFSAIFLTQLIATDPKRQRAKHKQKKKRTKNNEYYLPATNKTVDSMPYDRLGWHVIKTQFFAGLKGMPIKVLWLLVWCPVLALMLIADWSALVMWLGGLFILGWILVIRPPIA